MNYPIHPATPRRGRSGPRGRSLDAEALTEIEALIGYRPRSRELLIEHLHALQECFGHLSLRHLRALAEWMRLPMAEIYETASFCAHFDIVADDDAPPPTITIRVCDSPSCEIAGARALSDALRDGLDPAEVRVLRAPCMGRCDQAPVAEVGRRHLGQATEARVRRILAAGAIEPAPIGWPRLAVYRAQGGYGLLAALRGGPLTVEALAAEIQAAGLRGLGGAGFPTARKWQLVAAQPGPRYVVVNADEGEPGTFKDRVYLECSPHQLLEGALIAAQAVDAMAIYIYLRDEYPGLHRALAEAIEEVEHEGMCAHGFIQLRRGAGAYICGEESALIASLEGKPGKPRLRPPYVAERGLFGRPTLVNNVETLYWIPEIHRRGADWFAAQGRHGRTGVRSFSVSGRVNKPGVHLAPAGITVNELIAEFCGGMADGHRLLAYLPGGASGGILPASLGDLPLDFDTLQPHGCFIGSAAIVVISEQDDLKALARTLMAFFADESCGQCTPCRVGCEKMLALVERDDWDATLMKRLARVMQDASICGLGQAAPNPVLGLLAHFRAELAARGVRISEQGEG